VKGNVTYSIKATSLPTSGYDYAVRIEMPDQEPLTESGYRTSFGSAGRAIKRRARKALGFKRYMQVRRSMP
jgi:hypothetical protein